MHYALSMRSGLLLLGVVLSIAWPAQSAPKSGGDQAAQAARSRKEALKRWPLVQLPMASLQDEKNPAKAREKLRAELLSGGPYVEKTRDQPRRALLGRIGDWPTLAAETGAALAQQPLDMDATRDHVTALLALGRYKEALEVTGTAIDQRRKVQDEHGRNVLRFELVARRCESAWFADAWESLPTLCQARVDDTETGRILDRFLIRSALHSKQWERALALADEAINGYDFFGATWYLRGVALAGLGRAADAKAAWTEAARLAPSYSPTYRALSGTDVSVEQFEKAEREFYRQLSSRELGDCALFYWDLGMPERAGACLDSAEQLQPGARAAYLLAYDTVKQKQPTPEALAAARQSRHPLALALAAQAFLDDEKPDSALELLATSDVEWPAVPETNIVILRACEKRPSAALCSDSRWLRLRQDSHSQQNISRSVDQADSRFMGYSPPRVAEVELVPMAFADFPELDGLIPLMEKKFPNLKFRLASPVQPPEKSPTGAVLFDEVLALAPDHPGVVVLLDADLDVDPNVWRYGVMTPLSARGAVSVSRFRDPVGWPKPPGTRLSGEALRRSRERLAAQVASTLAKVLGMHFPCTETKCLLRFPRDMSEFDDKGYDFCPEHRREWERVGGFASPPKGR